MPVEYPFKVGALYHRRNDIHALYDGQRQGGISTPSYQPFVFIFTGEAGKAHGYSDFWESDEIFHYYGEGQKGDMDYKGGNRAIIRHKEDGKTLLLFQSMGRGKPYRFLGEMSFLSAYEKEGIPDTTGQLRKAIVFRLTPVDLDAPVKLGAEEEKEVSPIALGATVASTMVNVRKSQTLFRRRLVTVEKECRLTGVRDLRFLRASHIKPWASCENGNERTDGHNGLLLTPSADHLFDRGWISFANDGKLLLSSDMPSEVVEKIRLDLTSGRSCGNFSEKQQLYLNYHREQEFKKAYLNKRDASIELIKALNTD